MHVTNKETTREAWEFLEPIAQLKLRTARLFYYDTDSDIVETFKGKNSLILTNE